MSLYTSSKKDSLIDGLANSQIFSKSYQESRKKRFEKEIDRKLTSDTLVKYIKKLSLQKLEIVNNLLNDEKVKPYFSDNWIVKTEREILMENGKTYIPDRLLFSKITDEVVVIDYKTGLEKDAHENQITEYADALGKMGKKNIKRILVYISDEIKIKEL